MTDYGHIQGESPDARQRRIARAQRQAAQWTPGQSFEQWDRQHKLRTGEIQAGSTASLSERDRLRLGALRTDIVNGCAPIIPHDLRQHVNDLLGESPDSIAAAKTATSEGILATVEAMSQGKGIDAATQVQEWQKDHADRLSKQPLSRQLRQALGPHTIKISARMLHEECKRLGYSTSQCMSVALEASAKGIVLDSMAPEPTMLSDDAAMVLHSESLPMYGPEFLSKCARMNYSPSRAAALALECARQLYYGDKRVEVKDTRRSFHATTVPCVHRKRHEQAHACVACVLG